MNIFEGFRRITYLIAAIGAIGGAGASITQEPSVYVYYDIKEYGAKPVKSSGCNYDTDAVETMSGATTSGNKFNVSLCFKPIFIIKGIPQIEYISDEKTGAFSPRYSPEVKEYTENFSMANFRLGPWDYADVDQRYPREKWKLVGTGFGVTALSLLGFLLFTKITGWIVRGFFGIPNGADKQPPELHPLPQEHHLSH